MTRTDRNLTALLVLAFVVGVVVATATGAFATRPDLPASEPSPTATAPASAEATANAELPASEEDRRTPVVVAVERVAPSVVSITTETSVNSLFGPRTESGAGSGVVIDASGIVLTNAHVVNQAQQIKASFQNGETYDGTVLGLDTDLDLAVLRLEGAQGLAAVPIGSSAGLMLGEPVIAIGNPYGFGQTVTTGVVSSVHRAVQTKSLVNQDFIQTDASINPGNSGGPLLDVRGRLIGINTAIYTEGQNIGFAIPSDRAVKIAHDLLQFGQVQAPWLGCDLDDVILRSGPGSAPRTAAVVTRVFPGGGAAAAGLRQGDLLMAVDGRAVQGRGDLTTYLAAFPPGRPVELSLQRGSEARSVTVQAQALDPKVVDAVIAEIWGATLAEVPANTPGLRQGRARGVSVTAMRSDGAFASARLRVGDRIVAINGTACNNPDDLHQALARAKSAHSGKALLTIQRGQVSGSLYFPI